MTNIENRIRELGFELPESVNPIASYIPATISGNLVFTSGQLPLLLGKITETGILGVDMEIDRAQQAAKLCVINGLAAVKNLISDLDKIKTIVKLVGYVASDSRFIRQPEVINGASNLILEIFGEYGRHARTSIGVSSLPLNSPVEIEMIVELK